MNILLINPPLPERTYPGKAMGLDYIAKGLIDNGYTVRIVDLDVIGRNNLQAILEEDKPDVVGITNLSIQNDIANNISKTVKDFNSKIITVKGGYHELFGYDTTLRYHHDYVDYVVIGEGENTFLNLVKAHSKKILRKERQMISGLAYWENNKVVFNGRRTLLNTQELNELVPKRLFYDASYNYDVFDYKKTAQVMSVRGCSNSCNFCTESQTGAIERKRSIESIYSELSELSNEGYEAIYFDDSTFTRDRKRITEICRLFKNEFPELVWGCNTRDDCLDEDIISTMEQSGCVYVFTGFESAVPEVLLALNKTHNPAYYLSNAEKIYKRLFSSSIKSSVFLIFGAPQKKVASSSKTPGSLSASISSQEYIPETLIEVKRSVDFSLHRLKPRYLSMNILRLLPGVPFSQDRRFQCLHLEGKLIHSGYYDIKWYEKNHLKDNRTSHHIYRAFEARGSLVPPNMTPEYCYDILKYVVEKVNETNNINHYRCKIVVDGRFEEAYLTEVDGKYTLAPFKEIAES